MRSNSGDDGGSRDEALHMIEASLVRLKGLHNEFNELQEDAIKPVDPPSCLITLAGRLFDTAKTSQVLSHPTYQDFKGAWTANYGN